MSKYIINDIEFPQIYERKTDAAYHGSMPKNRNSIIKDGLSLSLSSTSSGTPGGIYLAYTMRGALAYGFDIFEVDIIGLNLIDIGGTGLRCNVDIPPERLRLVLTAENRGDPDHPGRSRLLITWYESMTTKQIASTI